MPDKIPGPDPARCALFLTPLDTPLDRGRTSVPTTWPLRALVAAIGPVIHWSFNVALFLLGVKARPA